MLGSRAYIIADREGLKVAQIIPDPGSTLILGRGFNTLTINGCATGIKSASVVNQSGTTTGGQDVTYIQKEITSIHQLRDELSVSASASFNALFGSGSASASFCNTLDFNSFSLFLMVHVKVRNDTQTFDQFLLDDACSQAAASRDLAAFLATYGNEFVAAQVTGGHLFAIFRFEFESEEQHQKVSSQVQGAGVTFNAGLDWKQGFDSIDKSCQTQLYIHRTGGSGPMPTAENIVSYALDFPDKVAPNANPLVSLFTTAPYVQTTNKPPGANFPDLTTAHLIIEDLLAKRDTAMVRLNDISYVLADSWQFAAYDSDQLNAAKSALQIYISRIDAAARKCLSDPLHCEVFSDLAPEVALPLQKLPSIEFTFLLHLSGIGDQRYPGNTHGGALTCWIEGFQLDFKQAYPGLGCQYMVHMAGHGDSAWVTSGNYAGTRGESCNIQGVAIQLTGPASRLYSVWYRGQSVGRAAYPMHDPVSDGAFLGSRGQDDPLLTLEVHIVKKTTTFMSSAIARRPPSNEF
jgi:hypothetical protein